MYVKQPTHFSNFWNQDDEKDRLMLKQQKKKKAICITGTKPIMQRLANTTSEVK